MTVEVPAPSQASLGPPILSAEGVSKVFGGLVAVNEVSVDILIGSIVSIIGPNGAGKTTLFNMLTGLYKATSGRIVFSGRDVTRSRADVITKLGVASPKTVALPNKDYIPGIHHQASLRNLAFPLDWDAVVGHVGLPCILKDAHGGGWKDVFVCRTREELLHYYDHSGLRTMIVQEFIAWEQFVRCLCIGQRDVLPIHYDPQARQYHADPDYLSPALRNRIVKDSLTLVGALGYDMNSIEWAVKDGVPFAIDFMNPAPDFDINSLTPEYFDWALQHMADLAIELAQGRSRAGASQTPHWQTLFKGRAQRAAPRRTPRTRST